MMNTIIGMSMHFCVRSLAEMQLVENATVFCFFLLCRYSLYKNGFSNWTSKIKNQIDFPRKMLNGMNAAFEQKFQQKSKSHREHWTHFIVKWFAIFCWLDVIFCLSLDALGSLLLWPLLWPPLRRLLSLTIFIRCFYTDFDNQRLMILKSNVLCSINSWRFVQNGRKTKYRTE